MHTPRHPASRPHAIPAARAIAAAALLAAVPVFAAPVPHGGGRDGVPADLAVPEGQVLALAAHGVGVQIYGCKAAADDAARFAWTLTAPEAVLRSHSGARLGRHFAGPTWEAVDGSRITGTVVTKSDAPDGRSIPWLLLAAHPAAIPGIFAGIASIQRVRTIGGLAPATGCDAAHAGAEVRVDYSADYLFYTPPR